MNRLAASPVDWLLTAGDPAVASLARREFLHEPVAGAVGESPVVAGLADGLTDEAALAHPYAKWRGAHWRLVSLVELGVGPDSADAVLAADRVLDYWSGSRRLAKVPVIEGRARRCASQEGNAIAVACRLGLAGDRRVTDLAAHVVDWQWPDGGWNCDRKREVTRSSVNETLPALWGLSEYHAATGDAGVTDAIAAAAEVLLQRDVVFVRDGDELIHHSCGELHYPPFWHYDALQALLVLHRAGFGADRRTRRARELVARHRGKDGRWRTTTRWWRRPGSRTGNVEAVDWQDVADQMVTLNACRIGAHLIRV